MQPALTDFPQSCFCSETCCFSAARPVCTPTSRLAPQFAWHLSGSSPRFSSTWRRFILRSFTKVPAVTPSPVSLNNRRHRVADNVKAGITLTFFASKDFIETGDGHGKFGKACGEVLWRGPAEKAYREGWSLVAGGITGRTRGDLQAGPAGDADRKRCGHGD